MNLLTTVLEIKPFNLIHILTILFFLAFALVSYLFFRKKTIKARSIFLWTIMAVAFFSTWITFAVDLINKEVVMQNFFARLPFQMCSINVILYPIFFALRNKNTKLSRILFSYMYFVGSPGALIAMFISPGDVLGSGVSLLTYNVFVYWIKHGLIFLTPILFISLGFFKPRFNDLVRATVFLAGLIVIMHLINVSITALSKSIGGIEIVNFFYTKSGKETAGLSIFWRLANEIELLYLLPIVPVLYLIFIVYYSPFMISNFRNKSVPIDRLENVKRISFATLLFNIFLGIAIGVLLICNLNLLISIPLTIVLCSAIIIFPLLLNRASKKTNKKHLRTFSILTIIFGGPHGIIAGVNGLKVTNNRQDPQCLL